MGMLRWRGKSTILILKQNEPVGILRIYKDGSVREFPYTTRRARKSKSKMVS